MKGSARSGWFGVIWARTAPEVFLQRHVSVLKAKESIDMHFSTSVYRIGHYFWEGLNSQIIRASAEQNITPADTLVHKYSKSCVESCELANCSLFVAMLTDEKLRAPFHVTTYGLSAEQYVLRQALVSCLSLFRFITEPPLNISRKYHHLHINV